MSHKTHVSGHPKKTTHTKPVSSAISYRRLLPMATLCMGAWSASAQTISLGDTIGLASGTYNCNALSSIGLVRVSLSANNAAAFACNTKDVGIAVANAKGRGVVNSVSTAGALIVKSYQPSRFTTIPEAAAASEIQAAARLVEAGT